MLKRSGESAVPFFLSSGQVRSSLSSTERARAKECESDRENWEYVSTKRSVKMPHSSLFLGAEAERDSVILEVAWSSVGCIDVAWLWAEELLLEVGCLCRSCCARVRRLLSGSWRGSRSFCIVWHSHCFRGPATARTHARAPSWSVTVSVCVCVRDEREKGLRMDWSGWLGTNMLMMHNMSQ